MIQILLGSILLGLTHALIPNHWFPLAAVSMQQKWDSRDSFQITLITGFLHTLSTIIIGVIIGFIGYTLSNAVDTISHIIAPALLALLGLIFLVIHFRHPGSHEHEHGHLDTKKVEEASKRSKSAVVIAIATMMFFSPCIEIEAYFFAAGQYGWTGILTLSAVYMFITLVMLSLLVQLARKGMKSLSERLHFLEHNERLINGIILIALAAFMLIAGE